MIINPNQIEKFNQKYFVQAKLKEEEKKEKKRSPLLPWTKGKRKLNSH